MWRWLQLPASARWIRRGRALGGLVARLGLDGFVALFLLNAATYLAYVAVLILVVRKAPPI